MVACPVPNELAPELEREERVPRCRLLYARQLGPCQLEPEPLLEQPVERTRRSAGRSSQLRVSRSLGKRRARARTRPRCTGAPRTRREQADGLAGAGAGAPSAGRPPRTGSSHWRSSSATSTATSLARESCSRSSTASPIACASSASSPGSTSQKRDLERASAWWRRGTAPLPPTRVTDVDPRGRRRRATPPPRRRGT